MEPDSHAPSSEIESPGCENINIEQQQQKNVVVYIIFQTICMVNKHYLTAGN